MLKTLIDPIRRGNSYRLEKFGPSNYLTGKEIRDYEKDFKGRKDYPVFCDPDWAETQDRIKERFGYLATWTGARYVIEENPLFDEKIGNPNAIATFDPNTGTWGAWTGEIQ